MPEDQVASDNLAHSQHISVVSGSVSQVIAAHHSPREEASLPTTTPLPITQKQSLIRYSNSSTLPGHMMRSYWPLASLLVLVYLVAATASVHREGCDRLVATYINATSNTNPMDRWISLVYSDKKALAHWPHVYQNGSTANITCSEHGLPGVVAVYSGVGGLFRDWRREKKMEIQEKALFGNASVVSAECTRPAEASRHVWTIKGSQLAYFDCRLEKPLTSNPS